MSSVPLIRVDRGRQQESLHRGAIVVVDRGGRVRCAAGDPDLPLYLRSAAKPLQAIPFVESGGAEAEHHPVVRNHEGQVVGEMRAVFTLEPVEAFL